MQAHQIFPRTFRAGVLVIAIWLLALSSRAQAQASDPNRCIEIAQYGFGSRYLVDTQTAQSYRVSRDLELQTHYTSPDGAAVARMNTTPGTYRLVLLRGDAAPQTIRNDSLSNPNFIPIADRLIWSADSRSFVYFWQTSAGAGYISLYSLDDETEQTLAFITPNVFSARLIGWSRDGRYFALSDEVDNAHTTRYTFLSTDPFAFHRIRLTPAMYTTGVWSPNRSEFATLAEVDDQHLELRITLMAGEPLVTQFAASEPSNLEWSPTGDVLLVTSAEPVWRYQVFQRRDLSMQMELSSNTSILWSADGTHLLWQTLTDPDAGYSLETLNVDTGTIETILHGIRAEDSAYIWSTALLAGNLATRTTAAPTQADTLIVPHRTADRFNLSVVDLNTGHVRDILTGLASLGTIGNLNFSFAPDETRFYVLPSTTEPNTITLINLNSLITTSYTATDAELIDSMRWSDPYHLAFAAHAGQTIRITSLDVRTMMPVVWGETTSSEWSLRFSPIDPTLAALQTHIDFQQGTLLLQRENEETPLLLSEHAPSRPVWSADGTRLAFDDYSSGQREIVVANHVGEILTRTPVLPDGEYGIIGFTDCSL